MPKGGLLDSRNIYAHTWGLMFGNAYSYLKVKGDTISENNKISFGYSPVSHIGITFNAKDLVTLTQILQETFMMGYDNYKRNDISKYVSSNQEMYKAMENKLYYSIRSEFISEYDNRIGSVLPKIQAIYDQFSINAKFGIFRTDYKSGGVIDIRGQIENLIIGHPHSGSSSTNPLTGITNIYQRSITFPYFLDSSNNPFEISFNKDDFNSRDIYIFRKADRLINQLKDSQFNSVLSNRVDAVRKTILDNGGKARFYLAYNTGPNTGYQHITTSSLYDYNQYSIPSYLLNPTSEEYQVVPYDIDLNDPKINEKLNFIVGLSMMFARYKTGNNIFTKTNLKIIMKLEGATASDPSICYFDHNGIGRLTSIYSTSDNVAVGGVTRRYGFIPVSGSLSTIGTFHTWAEDYNFFSPLQTSDFANKFGTGPLLFI